MTTSFVSVQLLAAQARLDQLKTRHRFRTDPETTNQQQGASPVQQSIHDRQVVQLPKHLGLGSARFTAVWRQATQNERDKADHSSDTKDWIAHLKRSSTNTKLSTEKQQEEQFHLQDELITIWPDLAFQCLQHKRTAEARIYYLLRYLDKNGRGWLDLAQIMSSLTDKRSPLFVVGPRQLRNLLSKGEETFWQQDKSNNRIWLRSQNKIARSFGIIRFRHHPVHLTLTNFLAPLGELNAHFYASFHSGRASKSPISRETISALTGISRRSQQRYEKIADVKTTKNYALGPSYSDTQREEQSWQRGQAIFTITDYRGIYGRKGAKYLAWQLSNSYQGPHSRCSRNKRKHLNRNFGLVIDREQGNDAAIKRIYCANGHDAARQWNRDNRRRIYWQSKQRFQDQWWHVLESER